MLNEWILTRIQTPGPTVPNGEVPDLAVLLPLDRFLAVIHLVGKLLTIHHVDVIGESYPKADREDKTKDRVHVVAVFPPF